MKRLRVVIERDLLGEFYRPATIDDAERKLYSAGWKKIGRGVFGSAYSHPNKDYILKLFKRDVAYKKYLDLIQAKGNAHFPKLRGLPMKVNNNYSAVRMEKLKPLSASSDDQRELHNQAQDYIRCLKKLDSFHIHNDRDIPQAKQLIKNLSEFSSQHPELADALNLIHKHVFKTTGAGWDLHGGNVMFRGKTLVITDPVAYGNTAGSNSPIYKDPKQLNLNFNKPPIQKVEPHPWVSKILPKPIQQPQPKPLSKQNNSERGRAAAARWVRAAQPQPPRNQRTPIPIAAMHWTNFHQSQPNIPTNTFMDNIRKISTNTFMDNIRKAKEKQQPIQPWIDTQRPEKKGKRGRPRKIDIERARMLRRQGMKYKNIAKIFHARTAAVWMAINRTPHQNTNDYMKLLIYKSYLLINQLS